MADGKSENIDFGRLEPRALAHYLGCKIKVYLRNQPPYIASLTPAFLGDTTGVKPILRPLSDIQEAEKREFSIFIRFYSSNEEIDYNEIIKENAQLNRRLLRNYFDLFGWIDAGLAIDATTLSPNPYNQD